MSDYEHKDGRGALFKNDRKEKETQPDYRGSAKIDGNDFYVSAWISETSGGGKYLSLSFQPKGAEAGGGGSSAQEDIPF